MKISKLSFLATMLLTMAVSLLSMVWLYPEYFTHFDFRVVEGADMAIPKQSAFWITNQFFQGGQVQLFDRYDLYNSAFTNISTGIYTPFNYVMGLGFVVLSQWVDHPAKFFHAWYLTTYHGFAIILRAFGLFLLAAYLTKSRLAAFVTTIVANAFCTVALITVGGMYTNHMYSCLPLILFCLVYYWDKRTDTSLAAGLCLILVAVAEAPLIGFGYFYQVLHVFLLTMFLFWLVFERSKKPLMILEKGNLRTYLVIALVVGILLLSMMSWGIALQKDFYLHDSGLTGSNGRFGRFLNPLAMIRDKERNYVSAWEIFRNGYDFTINRWYYSAPFLGISTMILTVVGLVLGKHIYKRIFIFASVMMMFLNVPSIQGGWMIWAHWVDALTNPFCFLVRSFHMSTMLWILSLGLPVSLGVNACWAMVLKQDHHYYSRRKKLMKVILGAAIFASFWIPVPAVRIYALSILGLFMLFMLICDLPFKGFWRNCVLIVICIMATVIEFRALREYTSSKNESMNFAYWDGLRIKPRIFGPMYTPMPMIVDYQNPRILPYRFYYRGDKQLIFPIMYEYQGFTGDYYRYSLLGERLLFCNSLYVPRFSVFKDFLNDEQMKTYIQRDQRMMYVANAGVIDDQVNYTNILRYGLDRQVVLVSEANQDKAQDPKYLKISKPLEQQFNQRKYSFSFDKAKVFSNQYGKEYQWKLPEDFPSYLATSVFTLDQLLWKLKAGDREFIPNQGDLVVPFTFDVNNIHDGYLSALIPDHYLENSNDKTVSLSVFTPKELVDIWRNTQDDLGFTYNNPYSGWWVMHYPYDKKWELFVDGAKVPISKINRYFIGVPLSAGEHKMLLRYWPNSPLRWMVPLSVITQMIVFFYFSIWSYRQCSKSFESGI